MRRALEVKEDADRLPSRRIHLAQLVHRFEIEFGNVDPEPLKRPLEARSIEKDVRAAVERESTRRRAGRQATHLAARFAEQYAMAEGGEAPGNRRGRRRRRRSRPLSLRMSEADHRPYRAPGGTQRQRGGVLGRNTSSSISGTNSAPRRAAEHVDRI